jgi:hypothetical protein
MITMMHCICTSDGLIVSWPLEGLALWLVIKMVILMEATGYSGPTLLQVGINAKEWLQVISS